MNSWQHTVETPPTKERGGASAADLLLDLAHERFTLHTDAGGELFAASRKTPHQLHAFRGGRFSLRAMLANAFVEATGKAASSNAIADALLAIEGAAQQTEPVSVALRVAHHDGRVFVDLGDAAGRVACIERDHWEVVANVPSEVRFRRSECTSPMPVPERGGDLEHLRSWLNISDLDWPLMVGWIGHVFALGPSPILLLHGQQGGGKSTAARRLVSLLDPSPAGVRQLPASAEIAAITAGPSRLFAWDNLSTLSHAMSDALCRLSTGETLMRRRLYSDSGVSVINVQARLILTAIDLSEVRGDLAERMLGVELTKLRPEQLQAERELDASFEAARPRLLGAVFDLVASMLGLPLVTASPRARMADFSDSLARVDLLMRLKNAALERYHELLDSGSSGVVDSDPIAQSLLAFAHPLAEPLHLTAAELLQRLERPPNTHPRAWPSTPRALSSAIRRAIPSLSKAGLSITPPSDLCRQPGSRARLFTIEPIKQPTAIPESTQGGAA